MSLVTGATGVMCARFCSRFGCEFRYAWVLWADGLVAGWFGRGCIFVVCCFGF